jgi:hypothetical protein
LENTLKLTPAAVTDAPSGAGTPTAIAGVPSREGSATSEAYLSIFT